MKKIILILIALIIVLIVLLTFWHKEMNPANGIIVKLEEKEKIISYSDLKKMEKTSFTTERGEHYSGYKLNDILKDFDPQNIKYIVLHSTDSGSLRLNKVDHDNAFLVWMADADSPSLRLIIPADEFGQRWLKYISSIDIHN